MDDDTNLKFVILDLNLVVSNFKSLGHKLAADFTSLSNDTFWPGSWKCRFKLVYRT